LHLRQQLDGDAVGFDRIDNAFLSQGFEKEPHDAAESPDRKFLIRTFKKITDRGKEVY